MSTARYLTFAAVMLADLFTSLKRRIWDTKPAKPGLPAGTIAH